MVTGSRELEGDAPIELVRECTRGEQVVVLIRDLRVSLSPVPGRTALPAGPSVCRCLAPVRASAACSQRPMGSVRDESVRGTATFVVTMQGGVWNEAGRPRTGGTFGKANRSRGRPSGSGVKTFISALFCAQPRRKSRQADVRSGTSSVNDDLEQDLATFAGHAGAGGYVPTLELLGDDSSRPRPEVARRRAGTET